MPRQQRAERLPARGEPEPDGRDQHRGSGGSLLDRRCHRQTVETDPERPGVLSHQGHQLGYAPHASEHVARARASRQLAVERYSWPAVASDFERLFEEARERVRAKLSSRLTRGAYASW